MDRVWATSWDECHRDFDLSDGFTLPSRGTAIGALRPALRMTGGPVLLTGDAGVGKTWLRRRMRAELPGSWRWVVVEPSAASDPAELYRLIGHGLGLADAGSLGAARLALADVLRDSEADGTSWVLAVEEAHGLSDGLLEEVRLLSNRLGTPGGFAGLMLVGQTPLVRRLMTRGLAPLRERLAARVHLRPLDFEEARILVDRHFPNVGWDGAVFERLYRDAGGNPRRLLRLARPAMPAAPRIVAARPAPMPSAPAPAPPPTPEPIRTIVASPDGEIPLLSPGKPPLRDEDGLIEVGWGDPVEEPEVYGVADLAPPPPPDSDEAIHDHYAALQAWHEWARNQGRAAGAGSPEAPGAVACRPAPATSDDPEGPEPDLDLDGGPAAVWAEGEQGFAPYGQLFSRLRQARDGK